jgi:hypothetical protein
MQARPVRLSIAAVEIERGADRLVQQAPHDGEVVGFDADRQQHALVGGVPAPRTNGRQSA